MGECAPVLSQKISAAHRRVGVLQTVFWHVECFLFLFFFSYFCWQWSKFILQIRKYFCDTSGCPWTNDLMTGLIERLSCRESTLVTYEPFWHSYRFIQILMWLLSSLTLLYEGKTSIFYFKNRSSWKCYELCLIIWAVLFIHFFYF